MGSILGAKVLKLWQIILLAVVFEATGAVVLGGLVSARMAGGLAENLYTDPTEYQIREHALAMVCVLIGSGAWLMVATLFSLPVSTTHSVVGSVIAVNVWRAWSLDVIRWSSIGFVALSWVLSPMLGCAIALATWYPLKRLVVHADERHAVGRMLLTLPFMVALTAFIMALFLLYKGVGSVAKDFPLWASLLISVAIAGMAGALTYFIAVPRLRRMAALRILHHETPS